MAEAISPLVDSFSLRDKLLGETSVFLKRMNSPFAEKLSPNKTDLKSQNHNRFTNSEVEIETLSMEVNQGETPSVDITSSLDDLNLADSGKSVEENTRDSYFYNPGNRGILSYKCINRIGGLSSQVFDRPFCFFKDLFYVLTTSS